VNNRLFRRCAALVVFAALLASCASSPAANSTPPPTTVAAPSPSATVVPTTAATTTSTPTAEAATTVPSTPTAQATIVVPTATAATAATSEATTAPTVASTAMTEETEAAAETAAALSETPIVTPTVVVDTTGSASGCVDAHAVTAEESTDLNAAGQQLAGSLDRFNQYRLDLDLDRENDTVAGRQTLVFTNRTDAPLPDLVFHLYPNLPEFDGELKIACASIDGSAVPTQVQDDWLLRVPFVAPLAPGATASVDLHWTTPDAPPMARSTPKIRTGRWPLSTRSLPCD
jgi:hypothetical protein